ncbi:MAG: leucine-rich repeat domain-containing protein [Bacilli bacterium]|nr:leucine-rich repeat domain-containing protein [Bacilli bacterium]
MKVSNLIFSLLCFMTIALSGCSNISVIEDEQSEYGTMTPKVYYTATFENYDGTFLYAEQVEEKGYASYRGPTPVRKGDNEYVYTFEGWDKPLSSTPIIAPTTFTAQYSSRAVEFFEVNFLNYDGATLYSTVVKEGEDAIYKGEEPTRPAGEGCTYVFVGWNKDTTNIRAQTDFVAVFARIEESFAVRFFNYNGDLLDVQYAKYGQGVTYNGVPPTKPSDAQYDYLFSGWDDSTGKITKNLDVHAVYIKTTRTYVVSFMNYDGSWLYETKVEYGRSATYKGKVPYRAPEGRIEYAFVGWSGDLSAIYSDIQVVAQFNKKDREATAGLSFAWSSDLQGYFVSGFSGSETEVFIPKVYDDGVHGSAPVREVASRAFEYKADIQSIFIEDNVTAIRNSAIHGLSRLKSVRLSNKLISIDNSAIYNCPLLSSLEVPSTVQNLDRGAFYDLANDFTLKIAEKNPFYKCVDNIVYDGKLTKLLFVANRRLADRIEIPEGVTYISPESFPSDVTTKTYVFPSTLEKIAVNAFFSWNGNVKSLIFKDSPCTIENDNFVGFTELETLDLGKKMVSLGYDAFQYCYQLKSIKLPATLSNIGEYAFWDCSRLSSIELDEENEYYTMMGCAVVDKDYTKIVLMPSAFSGEFEISDKYTGDFARILDNQSQKNAITKFKVSDNHPLYSTNGKMLFNKNRTHLIFIANAFTSISSSDIPSTVTHIDSGAGSYMQNITSLDLSGTNITSLGGNCFAFSAISKLTLSAKITEVGTSCFQGVWNLNEVTIPNGFATIGSYMFCDCGSLKTIAIPDSVTAIRNSAFQNSAISSIVLPDSVTELGENAFSNCYNLTSLTLSSAIKEIPSYLVYECYLLETVAIPESVTTIMEQAFYGWRGVKTFVIPDNVTDIRTNAFSDCTSLREITIGAGVTNIPQYCFSNDNNLETVDIQGELTLINYGAFSNCTSLKSIEIKGEPAVGNSAFNGCSLLESVTFANGVSSLGSSCFQGCSALKSIEIDGSITSVPNYCFANTNIESVEIKGSVSTIDSRAFSNCKKLVSIVLPETLQYIYDSAFYGCSSLTKVFFKGNANQWNSINIYNSNGPINNASKYFYSENEPTEEGNYWHYVEGVPTIWGTQSTSNEQQ